MTICYVFYLFCLQNDIFPYVHNFHFVMFYMVFGYRLILLCMICLCVLYVSVYVYCMVIWFVFHDYVCKNVCFKGCLCMLWYSCPCMVLSLEFGAFLCVLWGVYVYCCVWFYCMYGVWFYCMVVFACMYGVVCGFIVWL